MIIVVKTIIDKTPPLLASVRRSAPPPIRGRSAPASASPP